jgi:subtilisin family serine protease
MRRFFGFIGASFLFATGYIAAGQEFAKRVLIVKFTPDVKLKSEKGSVVTGIRSIDRLNKKYDVKEADRLFEWYGAEKTPQEVIIKDRITKVPSLSNIYRLKLDPDADIESAAKEYEKEPKVIYAEPDYIARACATPNDSLFSEQWGLFKIQAPDAWDIEMGDTTIIIGILDTGIDTAHPDIVDNLWINRDEIPGDSIDNDGNGFIDDIHGWNFVNNNSNPNDDAGHGTHCAGIASAVTNNSVGVAGVSWKSKLMAVKVLNQNGQGLYSDIAEGIVYAADNGAKVINMSLGGYIYSNLWENALTYAYATSVPVGAAGNDAKSDSFYPACFPMVLGVAATDSFDILWDGSNYGDWVDISAPGVGILSSVCPRILS